MRKLLKDLDALRGQDTKRDRFFSVLQSVMQDGRAVLVFTEYADTMEYLRDFLVDRYQGMLGTYSGMGGFPDESELEGFRPEVRKLFHDAVEMASRLRKDGWTQKDFANALLRLLTEPERSV